MMMQRDSWDITCSGRSSRPRSSSFSFLRLSLTLIAASLTLSAVPAMGVVGAAAMGGAEMGPPSGKPTVPLSASSSGASGGVGGADASVDLSEILRRVISSSNNVNALTSNGRLFDSDEEEANVRAYIAAGLAASGDADDSAYQLDLADPPTPPTASSIVSGSSDGEERAADDAALIMADPLFKHFLKDVLAGELAIVEGEYAAEKQREAKEEETQRAAAASGGVGRMYGARPCRRAVVAGGGGEEEEATTPNNNGLQRLVDARCPTNGGQCDLSFECYDY